MARGRSSVGTIRDVHFCTRASTPGPACTPGVMRGGLQGPDFKIPVNWRPCDENSCGHGILQRCSPPRLLRGTSEAAKDRHSPQLVHRTKQSASLKADSAPCAHVS